MPIPSTGYIDISFRLYLSTDVTEQEAKQIVSELDYELNHPLIDDSEVISTSTELSQ